MNEIEETGFTWMLLYWKIKVFKRPRWNTEVIVNTWARKYNKLSTWRDFEMTDENGDVIAIASSDWVLIDANSGKLARITEDLVNEYGLVEKAVFPDEPTGKLKEPKNMKKVYEYTSARRDIDTNNHVNNEVYLDLCADALPEGMSLEFSDIEIFYKKQIKLKETVSMFYSNEEGINTVCIKSEDGSALHAILRFS